MHVFLNSPLRTEKVLLEHAQTTFFLIKKLLSGDLRKHYSKCVNFKNNTQLNIRKTKSSYVEDMKNTLFHVGCLKYHWLSLTGMFGSRDEEGWDMCLIQRSGAGISLLVIFTQYVG
jgi:hypothetical protein